MDPTRPSRDTRRREHTRDEVHYQQYLLQESIVATERHQNDLYKEHQHGNCICKHGLRRPWWRRFVALVEWQVLPVKTPVPQVLPVEAYATRRIGLGGPLDPYQEIHGAA